MKPSLLCLLFLLGAAPAWAQTGHWVTASGNLEIAIAPCGDALCGTVAQVLANHSMSYPEQEIKEKPTLGMKILEDFTQSDDDTWYGHIYDRENGKTYRCRMKQISADELEVHPYVGLTIFGKTQVWHRASAPAEQKLTTGAR
jgi:uncharacterized protein (DUF2147 family)